jgi:predicted RNase H-like nuclease
MRAVLGIDAAWTLTEPSGVALVVESRGAWRLIAAEPSYKRFRVRAETGSPTQARPRGSRPDPAALLASATKLCGSSVELVAIDMPLAYTPITGRRVADDAVSHSYGARKCATHTPSASRPGPISDDLREGFENAGYPLLTKSITSVGIIEVYPHPALVELANASKRLPYKASRINTYWPSATPRQRRSRLFRQWRKIVALLEDEITEVKIGLPRLSLDVNSAEIKAYEDTLDAIICGWVAICALEGRATSFGDAISAIWIPNPLATGSGKVPLPR